MKIIKPSVEVLTPIDENEMMKRIELIARTCYKSEDLITDTSAERLVKRLIDSDHTAMLEHVSISVKVICDRGVSHEIVRHRMASYAQESTRYCNYSKDKFGNELTFIKPCFWEIGSTNYNLWENACSLTESTYLTLLATSTPQEARSVLPNSLKTEIVMTLNLRSWRNFFKLRLAKDAHPQMREVAKLIYDKLHKMHILLGDFENLANQ